MSGSGKTSPNAWTVLIVEDHPLVAKFYRLALERAGGFTCVVTENVAEIMQMARAGQLDVAVVDVSLSGSEWEGRPIDGLELTRLLKQHSPRPLPTLLATAHAMAGDRERLLAESGADDYLEKPVFDAELLVNRIRNLMRQQG